MLDMLGAIAANVIAKGLYKWILIVGGIAALGYIAVLKTENFNLQRKVHNLEISEQHLLAQVESLIEENSALHIISKMTMEQCEGLLKYEREKPSRPGAETPITDEYLDHIFHHLRGTNGTQRNPKTKETNH